MSDLSAHPVRPQLLRGNTVPLYVRTTLSSSTSQPESTSQTFATRPDKYSSVAQPAAASTGAASSSRMPQPWQLLPTPPLSTSPGSAESSYPDEAYFPAVSASQQQHQHPHGAGSVRPAKSHGPYVSSPLSPVTSPTVTSLPPSFQLLRNTRAPITHSSSAPMRIDNTPAAYILSAAIGPGFDSSCITIAMRKNNILDIVADRWDLEKDCHHEWQVQFDRDADMSGVHASYTNGVLTVTVKRLNFASARPPQMRP